MNIYLASMLFFAIAFVAVISVAIEKNTMRKQLQQEAYSHASLSIRKDFFENLWDLKNFFNFSYYEKPKENKDTRIRYLIRNLVRSTAQVKMISYSVSRMDQLLFFKIYSIESEEVSYDCYYKDLEMNAWFFQDQRKNPSIDRPAAEFESGLLEELLQLLPQDKAKLVIEF